MAIDKARAEGGDTVLTGMLADQAALYGVLAESRSSSTSLRSKATHAEWR